MRLPHDFILKEFSLLGFKQENYARCAGMSDEDIFALWALEDVPTETLQNAIQLRASRAGQHCEVVYTRPR